MKTNGIFPPGCTSTTTFQQSLNQVNTGQSIPVKFSQGGNYGLNIFAASYPVSQQISCSSTAPVDVIKESGVAPVVTTTTLT